MQNRYSGDVGDFGKFGFLRHLCDGRTLGVVWYLYPDERGNGDGGHVDYLDDNQYRECESVVAAMASWLSTTASRGRLGSQSCCRERLSALRSLMIFQFRLGHCHRSEIWSHEDCRN